MNMFDSVVIACDPTALDVACAIRSSLELFRLRVHFYPCWQKRNALDVLSGNVPPSDYVVLACHGSDDGEGITFVRLVDRVDGQWTGVDYKATTAEIPTLVQLPGRTVLGLGCRAGDRRIAEAFLRAGCKAYIGPERYVDQDACAVFAIMFFYHLLAHERPGGGRLSEQEACQRAMSADPASREGPGTFRYYDMALMSDSARGLSDS